MISTGCTHHRILNMENFFAIFFLLGTKKTVLSEYILRAVLKLLDKEVPENGRNLHQYFSFFCLYMNLGTYEVINAEFIEYVWYIYCLNHFIL